MTTEGAQILYWFDLGDVAVVPLIEDRRLLIETGEFFPEAPPASSGWFFDPPWYDPDRERLVYLIQSFAVCSRDAVVLVDGCVGAGKDRRRPAFHRLPPLWQRQFEAAGLRAGDVTAMLFTHLHVDHVGAATVPAADGWRPAFPGVPHYLSGAEFSYWSGESGRTALSRTGDYLADSVLPIRAAGDLVLIDAEIAIDSHVQVREAVGHTPGNLIARVTGSDGSLLLTGDVLHHPVQLAFPELSTSYCVSGAQAAAVRRRLLREVAETATPIVPSHFAAPSIGRVRGDHSGYAFDPAPDLLRKQGFDYRRWRAELPVR